MISTFVFSGCDVNSPRRPGPNGEGDEEARDGQCPLHLASSWGLEEVAQCLLEFGANVNAQVNTDIQQMHTFTLVLLFFFWWQGFMQTCSIYSLFSNALRTAMPNSLHAGFRRPCSDPRCHQQPAKHHHPAAHLPPWNPIEYSRQTRHDAICLCHDPQEQQGCRSHPQERARRCRTGVWAWFYIYICPQLWLYVSTACSVFVFITHCS